MRNRLLLLLMAGLLAIGLQRTSEILRAQTSAAALSGQITSADDGPMEGVLVSVKKDGSTITVTVVSDEHGQYRFPSAKLTTGHYSLRIRAVGYELSGPQSVDVVGGKPATADLK